MSGGDFFPHSNPLPPPSKSLYQKMLHGYSAARAEETSKLLQKQSQQQKKKSMLNSVLPTSMWAWVALVVGVAAIGVAFLLSRK